MKPHQSCEVEHFAAAYWPKNIYEKSFLSDIKSESVESIWNKARLAVNALRVVGADISEPIEINTDECGSYVSGPDELFDALQEFMSNSNEQTLVYKAKQPLIGMVFGRHGSSVNELHNLGANLELSGDHFRIKCSKSKAHEVQELFEKKLAAILVRLNRGHVTVVMRPEKIMVMLSPFTLTPVIVTGLLSPQIVTLRIYDPVEESRFEEMNNNMQNFYSQLRCSNRLKDCRLSLPISTGSIACYYDPSANVFMRVVVEALDSQSCSSSLSDHRSDHYTICARIWKIDYGSYATVQVENLYRLQTYYLQVRRQSIPAKLLYAKKKTSLSLSQVFSSYFLNIKEPFYALSVMEEPVNLSHIILLHRSASYRCSFSSSSDSSLSRPCDLGELRDFMDYLQAQGVYEVQPYQHRQDFSRKFKLLPYFASTVEYSDLCRLSCSAVDQDHFVKSKTPAQEALEDLVCPYHDQPERRFIEKNGHDLLLSEKERPVMEVYPAYSRKLGYVESHKARRYLTPSQTTNITHYN